MAEFKTPYCEYSHDGISMTKVWSDGRGNAVYQCPTCGRKMQVKDDTGRR